ncbi:response regulator [Spirochaetota bacterium]
MERKKIYIVEDSKIVSLNLKNNLEKLGFEVVGSTDNGKEAITQCINIKPDLILMDIKLPGKIDGIQSSIEIMEHIDIPIIFITAYSDNETIEKAQLSNPYGYLIKPYTEKDLHVTIETALTRFEYEKKLEESEEKYRNIFEGSTEIIFTLDDNLNILSINKSVSKYLKEQPKRMISKNFMDLIYHVGEGKYESRDILKEKIELFAQNEIPLSFKTQFISNFNNEPIDMTVKLEYINIRGKNLIIGRASKTIEDELKYLVSENITLEMQNYFIDIDDISHIITKNLKKYMDHHEVDLLRFSVREILINAIEHGNLEISFDEKSKAIEDDNYMEFIAQRQKNVRYRKRKVQIESVIDPGVVCYTITDEGKGFDHISVLNGLTKKNTGKKELYHGRGIKMAKKIFDEINYNKKGNEVKLTKYM